LNTSTTESVFPSFPKDIIQGVAKDFVNLYSPIRETPEAFLWLSFVTYLGNAISPYVRLDCASSEPRFYSVVIGKSGRTRKSAGNNVARDLFKRAGAKDQRIIEGFGSAEGMLVSLGDCDSPKPVILFLDEMNILASKTDISGSVGIAALHKLFEDHDYDHPLAQGNYTVRNAYLSLIGASTLEDFTKTWSAKHKDTGFFSRLLVVAADTDKRIHRPLDPDANEFDGLVHSVKGLVSSVINASPTVLKMDQEADELWKTFYNAFGDGPEWNRIDTYGFRLMVIQAVLRSEETVNKENVQQVIDFLEYEVAVREAVSPVIAENPVAQMEELIRRHLPEGKTLKKRDLQRKTNYQRLGIQIFDRAIANMIGNKEITPKTEGKSVFYTRANFEEDEPPVKGGTSSVGIGGVVSPSEDRPMSQNPNEIAAFGEDASNCLQFSTQSRVNKEMIM
jgi:hypothetical protein